MFMQYLEKRGGGGGHGISGRGLSKPRTRGEGFRNRIEGERPVKRKPYVAFGRYVIHLPHLENDIVMIKMPSGHSVANLPSSKVSSKLGGVLRSLAGGAIPDFNSISNLSREEKHTLHHIAKHSHLDNRFAVPKPDLTEQEADYNKFEIMKGEIQSGNNSKELIKDFKMMLLKFMNRGIIPRRQGQEILLEITAMGL